MRLARQPERPPPELPWAAAERSGVLDDARRISLEEIRQTERRSLLTEERRGRLAERPRGGIVGEPHVTVVAEGNDDDVDLGHHFAEQRPRLHLAEALLAERAA